MNFSIVYRLKKPITKMYSCNRIMFLPSINYLGRGHTILTSRELVSRELVSRELVSRELVSRELMSREVTSRNVCDNKCEKRAGT